MEANERILDKAHDLFMQFGIRSVSMDDIAGSLSISKKTIYHYFADKDELVDAIIEGEIKQMQDECSACSTQAADAVHEIFLTMERIVEQLRNMNPMVLYDLEKFHYRSFQKFTEHKNKFMLRIIRDNIEWGIKEELYRPEIDADVISKFRLESTMIPFNIHLFPPGKYNVLDLTREIILHYVYGLATVKGHKLIQKYNQQFQIKH
ncbi:MAG: TetR/AcrR family transcriptional regulator [Bacteroidetes bacterium]|nr:TetR/AcrR family transcriptional regulator [Bacteroidota bacterium]